MLTLKLLVSVAFCAILHSPSSAQQRPFKGTLYIVRHAEKDTGNNPALSAAGKQRALDLYRELKDEQIDLILVSQYRRTGMTGDSLRLYNNIDTLQYKADTTGDSVAELLATKAGKAKNILIIGHSNTVPVLVKNAGVENYQAKDLPDNEYDNLFIVYTKKDKVALTAKKYGKPSPTTAPAPAMKISQ